MPSALLETKLYAPKRRPSTVARPRLRERLNRGISSKLTLISAPAGFGKTTVVADWLGAEPAGGPTTAWLSLDSQEIEPSAFWRDVAAALAPIAPTVTTALAELQTHEGASDAFLTALLNELNTLANETVLVLDDYHAIVASEVHNAMAFFVEHLPPQMHLVIMTRADPPLPLPRLRARGELTEIRAADLRFTPDEASAYLNGSMGLTLSERDVAALEDRTEGWIAALQLAALSMQGRDDAADFIAGFTGDDRYVVDYLVEEVLRRQSEDVRTFLLHTSILDRLSAALCDAVTGQSGGRAMLETLDRLNLFVVPLDDRRRWYRYHHLFADVLRTHLLDEDPDRIDELHRRASAWYQREGELPDAIQHAFAGKDFVRAADLVELAMSVMHQRREERLFRTWLEALPRELFRERPVLSVAYAGALMSTGEVGGVETLLDNAEQTLAASARVRARRGSSGMVVVNESELGRLPGTISMYRAALALARGDLDETIRRATQARELADADALLQRGGAAALVGLAHWTGGDLEEAYRWYTRGMASLEKAGHQSDVVGGAVTLADIRITQGRLRDAIQLYRRGLSLATAGGPPLRGAADMHVGLSAVYRERNELELASQHLSEARGLGDQNGLPKNPARSRLAAARIHEACGEMDAALTLLDEAEHVFVADFSPDFRPIAAVKARLWIGQGRLSEALDWAHSAGVTPNDELSYVREFEHSTLARLRLAQGRSERGDQRIDEAIELSERLRRAAENGGRGGSVIDILVVQALALHARGKVPGALAALDHAIALAEPEGYVRVFLDEGRPMAELLKLAARRTADPTYARRLLGDATAADATARRMSSLIEPLSDRELDVLRLLTSDLDGPGIARELVVSLNTVRTHTKNIYAKLGVNSRRAAVRRAADLELLSRPVERPSS